MYAAIDIGTNSVRLLLYDEKTGEKRKFLSTTRIGEGLVSSGVLSVPGMERTHRAIIDYYSYALEQGAQLPIYCYATSAVRQAANGPEFMNMLRGKQGLIAEIISGEAEAEYGFLGAIGHGSGVVMDIGGGSTEFIAGQDGKILRSGSALLGCVSSLERCVQEDPPTGGEIDTLRAYIRERAVPLCRQVLEDRSPSAITGIGGTVTQLAMILTGAEFYTPELINGMRISRDQLEELMQRLISMDLKTRKALPGMDPNRADVIVSGGLITLEMLLAAGCKTLVVCDDDGLDGYLLCRVAESG